MRNKLMSFMAVLCLSWCNAPSAFAEGPATAALNQMATPVTPAVSPALTPVQAAITPVTPIPAGTPNGPAVAVALPAAPPTWAQELMVTAENLPVVGPILTKVIMYVAIVTSILTALVATLLTVLNTLMGVMNLSGLVNISTAIAAFRDGKIMYWLRFFSLFNATKTDPPTGPTVS